MQHKYEILIVDDISENIKVAISILKNENYNFSYALSGEQAVEVLKSKRFDLILLDVMMPGIDGFQLCEMIKNSPTIRDTPVIFVTAKVDVESIERGFKLGAVDYVTKPYRSAELRSRVANHVELYSYRKKLKKDNLKLAHEVKTVKSNYVTSLELIEKEIISMFSAIMESESVETACHISRVANISKQLGRLESHLSPEELNTLCLTAPLYDIGKILIDGSILRKKGPLTDDEFASIKNHPTHAANIFEKSEQKLIKAAKIIAHQHHENYDGSGYPQGLKGDEIHIYARIVAIADVLDTVTHDRTYEEAWSFEKAAKYIIDLSGTKFDPRLVKIFHDHLEVFKEIIEDGVCK